MVSELPNTVHAEAARKSCEPKQCKIRADAHKTRTKARKAAALLLVGSPP
jgi:hypothetical protein